MKKYLLTSFVGLFITLIGVALAVFALETKAAFWMVGGGFALIPVGGFILFLAVKKSSLAFLTKDMKDVPDITSTGFEDELKKKNELMNDYRKTSQMRDQLKVLQVSSAAESPK